MTVTVSFDKILNHPILPEDVTFGDASVIGTLPVSDTNIIRNFSVGNKTAQVTLKGVPQSILDNMITQADAYMTSLLSGAPSGGLAFNIGTETYTLITVEQGAPATVNGAVTYLSVVVTGLSDFFRAKLA